jgi:hypothetical protein
MKLDERDHRWLVLWATDCAEHVLPYFGEKHPKDRRPRSAVEAGRAWARGEITTSEARAAAFAAHVAGHAHHAANYAVTAARSPDAARERDWQYRRLPKHLRPVAFPARGETRPDPRGVTSTGTKTPSFAVTLYRPMACATKNRATAETTELHGDASERQDHG